LTWSSETQGSSVAITAEGVTLVQFRVVDNAGNASDWAPANTTAVSFAMLDRSAPSVPTVGYTVGAAGCSAGPKTLQSTRSADPFPGSGLHHYEYTVGGGPVRTGATATVSAAGTAIVAFRAVDALGNLSAWVPTTVRLS
jgi:hypothetical protein